MLLIHVSSVAKREFNRRDNNTRKCVRRETVYEFRQCNVSVCVDFITHFITHSLIL